MKVLKETADATGTWVAIGIAVGLGWQLSKVVSGFVYEMCVGAIDTIIEHMKK